MKAFLILLILNLTMLPVHAEDWRETCSTVGELATTIMESRQSGASMAKLMEAVPEGGSYIETLIISAYDVPRYSTERMQKKAVEEFRDEVYLECVKALRE